MHEIVIPKDVRFDVLNSNEQFTSPQVEQEKTEFNAYTDEKHKHSLNEQV